MRIAAVFMIALLTACTEIAEIYEEFGEHEEDQEYEIHTDHIEVLTLGPYTKTCYGPFEQDCFMEYNEEAGQWHFSTISLKASILNLGTSIRLR